MEGRAEGYAQGQIRTKEELEETKEDGLKELLEKDRKERLDRILNKRVIDFDEVFKDQGPDEDLDGEP
eukprot:14455358-Alexandrium_andersonii.AAC.1